MPVDRIEFIRKVASERFHFVDQGTVRLDAGFHNALYLGTAFGVVF